MDSPASSRTCRIPRLLMTCFCPHAVPCRVHGLEIQGRDCGEEAAQWITHFLDTQPCRLVHFEPHMQLRNCRQIKDKFRPTDQVRGPFLACGGFLGERKGRYTLLTAPLCSGTLTMAHIACSHLTSGFQTALCQKLFCLFVLDYTWQCSGNNSGSALRIHSSQCSGNHVGCQRLDTGWPHVR